jgi:hypothetical protein
MNANPTLSDAVAESVKMANAWNAYANCASADLDQAKHELQMAQAKHDLALATFSHAAQTAKDCQARVDQIAHLLGIAPIVAKDVATTMPAAPIALVPDGPNDEPSKARSVTKTTTRTRTRKAS